MASKMAPQSLNNQQNDEVKTLIDRQTELQKQINRARLILMEHHDAKAVGSHINIGTGTDVSIRELAEMICEVVGYEGTLEFDASKPDGTPRKLLDVSRMGALGWRAPTALRDGLERTYEWFLEESDRR